MKIQPAEGNSRSLHGAEIRRHWWHTYQVPDSARRLEIRDLLHHFTSLLILQGEYYNFYFTNRERGSGWGDNQPKVTRLGRNQ